MKYFSKLKVKFYYKKFEIYKVISEYFAKYGKKAYATAYNLNKQINSSV